MKSSVLSLDRRWLAGLIAGLLAMTAGMRVWADVRERSVEELKSLSLEDLMNIEVTTVSRRSEKLSHTASAVQVVTGEEIRRSTAKTLPEALRLAGNLQVAQFNAHDWAVAARGFNGAPLANNGLADKLLVMIDGRSVYTPLFGGVFWDAQHVLLEDIDRIEVVSGPGGTMWGANAVNGVINVVTKSARETQGVYASGAAGTFLQDFGALRYGGSAGSNLFYRVYAQRFDHEGTKNANGSGAPDDWEMTQGGFRADYYPTKDDTLTLQGDFYAGNENRPTSTILDGQNVLGRWTRVFSDHSEIQAQLYFDRTWRNFPARGFNDDLQTWDLDLQHQFPLGERQNIVWGAGYRMMRDDARNSPALSFQPPLRHLQLFSTFLQDEIEVVEDHLKLTLGMKFEHNDYTGLELQPSARLAWMPGERNTLWAAVSRAIHSPSRFDTDISQPFPGDPDFDSVAVIAYEAGWRVRPADPLSISLAVFYNEYDEVRSVNFPPLTFGNDQSAESWGTELSASWQPADWVRLRGAYTFFGKDFDANSPLVFPGSDRVEGLDARHQVTFQSIMDLPAGFQLDTSGRFVDALPASPITFTRATPSYVSLDVRLGWEHKGVELSVAGQNLLDSQHPEFGALEIPRSVYGKVAWRF